MFRAIAPKERRPLLDLFEVWIYIIILLFMVPSGSISEAATRAATRANLGNNRRRIEWRAAPAGGMEAI